MSDIKKDSLNKKISIKNKKEAVKALNKNNKTKKTKKNNTSKKKISTYNKKNIAPKKIKEEISNTEKKTKNIKEKTPNTKKVTKKIKESKIEQKKNKEVNTKIKSVTKKTEKDKIFNKISTKLKDKIFEEVNENDEQIINEKKDKKNQKKIKWIISSVIILLTLAIITIFLTCNQTIKKSLTIYEEYTIGQKVVLNDNSTWYVIEDSGKKEETVKLLKETQIDINGDGIFDNNDKKKFSSTGKEEYDVTDKDSAAYYLENEYKTYMNQKIGPIKSISLITSKEFVNARNHMGYNYEWTEGNWLANDALGTWWINTSQNGKIYAVSKTGSYKLYSSAKINYIRPVITIDKNLISVKD